MSDLIEYEATDDGSSPLPETIDLETISRRIEQEGRFIIRAEIKAVDEERREIEGYASTKDIDRVNEIIKPTAFQGSMDNVNAGRIKILHNHEGRSDIVGTITKGKIDKTGLFIRGKILKNVPQAEIDWQSIIQGGLDSFSVGFVTIADEIRKIGGRAIRVITDLDLFEISLANMPANTRAGFSVVKSLVFWEQPIKNETIDDDNYRTVRDHVVSITKEIDAETDNADLEEAVIRIRNAERRIKGA